MIQIGDLVRVDKNSGKKFPTFAPENKIKTSYIVSQQRQETIMKITKARLKEIIKEELENLNESLTGTMDAERRLAMDQGPRASMARKSQGAELRRLARSKGEESPEVAAARQQLVDKGMLDARTGRSLTRGNSINDVEDALKAMNTDAATMDAIIRKLEALYR